MQIRDVFPGRAFYKPGETVEVFAQISAGEDAEFGYRWQIYALAERVHEEQGALTQSKGEQTRSKSWRPPEEVGKGYGVVLEIVDENGQVVQTRSTAFDVLQDWTAFPRYGFLCDFDPQRTNIPGTQDNLRRFHINGLQFYDWQFRHDSLLPSTSEYIDPLGRPLSLHTVRQLIDAAHEVGIAAMPYLAVYAASLEFWQNHPAWALYDKAGKAISFEGFLGLMNPSADSPWIAHLLAECQEVLAGLPFDGLHVDQYGEPKVAFDSRGEPVDIPAAFKAFIGELRSRRKSAAITFNAVGNWPIEALASSEQDFEYIEVWPPTPHYKDLREIVRGARERSNGRPVVIALYLQAEDIANILLADALIFSAGGTRIEVGEGDRLLTDPYFPKHQPIGAALMGALRRYYDFVVRYGELLGPDATESPLKVESPPQVWNICRSSSRGLAINLINFTGIQEPFWTQAQEPPTGLRDFQISIPEKGGVEKVWWASADSADLSLQPATFHEEGDALVIEVPALDYWTMLFLETQNGRSESGPLPAQH